MAFSNDPYKESLLVQPKSMYLKQYRHGPFPSDILLGNILFFFFLDTLPLVGIEKEAVLIEMAFMQKRIHKPHCPCVNSCALRSVPL